MLTKRDKEVLASLNLFKIMSRDHFAKIHFSELNNAAKTANRVCKRLCRDGHMVAIPQPRDRPFLYKAPDAGVRENTSKLGHYLSVVDAYIDLGAPEHVVLEPPFRSYIPDMYIKLHGEYICVEVQRSRISSKKMQEKINKFVQAYLDKEHDARKLYIYSPYTWNKLQGPEDMIIKIIPLP